METAIQIQSALRLHSCPLPSVQWLHSLVTSTRQTGTLAALIMTARTRLLASDLAAPDLLDPTYLAEHIFPAQLLSSSSSSSSSSNNNNSITVKEARLPRDVVVQVLDLENLNRSRWEQVEELEAVARGEQTRGRQVIRLPTTDTDDDNNNNNNNNDGGGGGDSQITTQSAVAAAESSSAAALAAQQREKERQLKNATHKLVLQDAKGQEMFALELRRIERIAVGSTQIGEKMLLKKGTVVARGVLLIEPSNCQILGGKVEAWNRAWVEGRLVRLREAVGGDART